MIGKLCWKVWPPKRFTSDECIEVLKKYSIVSFDVFDTLIKRNVYEPSDIFAIVEQEYLKKYCVDSKFGFVNKRIQAELNARNKTDLEEITIEQIYDELGEYYTKEECEWLKSKENEIEYRLCCVNPDIQEVYDYCRKTNKTIIITTDIYLHKTQIERMLTKCGISNWSHLFVSSDLKKTKVGGSLYDYILNELCIDRGDIIHIGDNQYSDYICAERHGIKGLLIPQKIIHLSYNDIYDKDINNRCVSAFINNQLSRLPKSKQIGFECFGPLLYGFVTWLYREIRIRGIKDIFFLSRDGLIIKRAFDCINNDSSIKSYYFLASRRALRIPLLAEDIDYLDYINRNFWDEQVSTSVFLKEMGISEPNGIDPYIDENICHTVQKKSLSEDKILKNIFEIAIRKIRVEAIREKEAFIEYAKQSRIGETKSAIVDIGWHGNMQVNIEHLLDGVVSFPHFDGYYIGIIPFDNHHKKVSMQGFLFDDDKNLDIYTKEADVNPLFEQVFMAPHGSVKRYCKNKDGVFGAKLCDNEQTDEKAIWMLKEYQEGGLEFIRSFKSYSDLFVVDVHRSANGILNQFLYPNYKDTLSWGELYFKDIDERKLVTTSGWLYYFFHQNRFLNDFRRSVWKEGFLKRTFKLDIDYYRLIKFRQKVRKIHKH